jgi:hypothetical protein
MDISRLRRVLGVANIASTLALVFALAGGAYASGLLPANSVGTKQLRNRAVTAAKLARGAVDSSKVEDGTIRAADFAPSQQPVGPVGPTGPPGAAGATGPPSAPTATIARADFVLPANAAAPTAGAISCAEGLSIVGGGAAIDGITTAQTQVLDSAPDGRSGWKANAINATSTDRKLTVYAVCIAAAQTAP